MTIGERIKKIRKSESLSQAKFGESIDLKQTIIGQYETGERNVPERTINAICEKYNINKEWLLHGTGEIEKNNRQTALEEITKKYTLNDMETKFIKLFLTLNNKDKYLILDLMKRISDDK